MNDTGKLFNLARTAYYLEDATGKKTWADVQKADAEGAFKKLDKPQVNFGVSGSAFWIKCGLRNETSQALLLELGNTTLADIQLYEVDAGGRLLAEHRSGSWLPFHRREINDVNYRFKLAAAPQATETLWLRVQNFRGTQFPMRAGTPAAFYDKGNLRHWLEGMYYGIILLMVMYNLFIYFSLRDPSYIYYVLCIFFMGLWNACRNGYTFKYLWPASTHLAQYIDIIVALSSICSILFTASFLNTRQHTPFVHRLLQVVLFFNIVSIGLLATDRFLAGNLFLEINSLLTVFSLFIAAFLTLRRGYRPARFFLIAWSLLLFSAVVFILKDFNLLPYTSLTAHSLQIGSAIEVMLLSLALADRINIYKKEKEAAHRETLQSMEENKQLILEQNVMLEKKVGERTQALKKTNDDLVAALENLKATQQQLIHTEKMASLGQLAAGIAHEIQNPLNFVNNFSEVSLEMLEDIRGGLKTGNTGEALAAADGIAENLQKIIEHGKRADGIVKGMLQHSRKSTGQKEPTDINKLTDEYLRLSYHGLKAKDKSFNATLHTDFDKNTGTVNVMPQEIGRVLINLFSNAFYAVTEKKAQQGNGYEPTVSVSTRRTGNKVELRVRDNGAGIRPEAMEKLFQPFFTTRPSGRGTGLGLSLSYDIITKGHGGTIKVDSKEGEYAEFIVALPA